jgi:hypothetical protein
MALIIEPHPQKKKRLCENVIDEHLFVPPIIGKMFLNNKEQLSTHIHLFRFLAAGHILKMLNAFVLADDRRWLLRVSNTLKICASVFIRSKALIHNT